MNNNYNNYNRGGYQYQGYRPTPPNNGYQQGNYPPPQPNPYYNQQQQYYNQQQYYQPQPVIIPQPVPQVKKGTAIASMILGILSLLLMDSPIISLVCAIISLCLAGSSKRTNGRSLGMATAGKVCSIIAIIFSLLMIVFYVFYFLILIDFLLYGYDGSNFDDFYYTAMRFIR